MYKRIFMSLIIMMGLFTGACQQNTTEPDPKTIIGTVEFNAAENQFEATSDTGETVAICDIPEEYPYFIHIQSIETNQNNNITSVTFEYIPNPFYTGNCGTATDFEWTFTKYASHPNNQLVETPAPVNGNYAPTLDNNTIDPNINSSSYTSTSETITVSATTGQQGWFTIVSFTANYDGCGAVTTDFETLEDLGDMAPISVNILFCNPFDPAKLTVSLILPKIDEDI